MMAVNSTPRKLQIDSTDSQKIGPTNGEAQLKRAKRECNAYESPVNNQMGTAKQRQTEHPNSPKKRKPANPKKPRHKSGTYGLDSKELGVSHQNASTNKHKRSSSSRPGLSKHEENKLNVRVSRKQDSAQS